MVFLNNPNIPMGLLLPVVPETYIERKITEGFLPWHIGKHDGKPAVFDSKGGMVVTHCQDDEAKAVLIMVASLIANKITDYERGL